MDENPHEPTQQIFGHAGVPNSAQLTPPQQAPSAARGVIKVWHMITVAIACLIVGFGMGGITGALFGYVVASNDDDDDDRPRYSQHHDGDRSQPDAPSQMEPPVQSEPRG